MLTRATGTALVLLLLMKLQGVVIAVPRALMPRLAGAGVLVAVQSYCLYSAVALIPAALALLVFQTSAMLYLLLSWATGKEKPQPRPWRRCCSPLAGWRWSSTSVRMSWRRAGARSAPACAGRSPRP